MSFFLGLVLATLLSTAPLVQAVPAPGQTIEFSKTVTFDGKTLTAVGSLTVQPGVSLTGSVTITVTDETGAIVFQRTFNIDITTDVQVDPSVQFSLMVPEAGLFVSISITVVAGTTPEIVISVTRNPDVTGDGLVNILDLVSVAGNFLSAAPPAPTSVDLNADGSINILDLVIVAKLFLARIS